LSINVEVYNAHGRRRARMQGIAKTVRCVLLREARKRAAISVVLVGDRAMARINRKFLAHRGTTDVISFPLEEGANLEGEIYVNLDRAARQAREEGVSGACEVARLVIHGTLHLVGYDDRGAREARRMKAREDRYVEELFRQRRAERNP
jgi:rRNA maturation RNase YbeY